MQRISGKKKFLKISKVIKIYIPLLKWDIRKNNITSNRQHKIELIYKESRDLFY